MNERKIAFEQFHSETPTAVYDSLFALKNLYRQGWLHAGLPEKITESVAEHSYSLSFLCLYYLHLYPVKLNEGKIIKMAIIHDLAEGQTGDFIPAENIDLQDKHNKEKIAFQQIFANHPEKNEWIKLWEEFESGSSEEGLYVKQMDKIDMLFQALTYHRLTGTPLDSFFKSTENIWLTPFFENLYRQIKADYNSCFDFS